MVRKAAAPEPQPARLTIMQMANAVPKLGHRLRELRAFDLSQLTGDDSDDAKIDPLLHKYNQTLLDIFLDANTIEYRRYYMDSLYSSSEPLTMGVDLSGYSPGPDVRHIQRAYQNGINKAISNLETILSLFGEAEADAAGAPQSPGQVAPAPRVVGKKVFIVHGRDNEAKEEVARFIEKLELEAIILHEQPSGGLTIIEKLERHLDADFAVVLLTPDDVGSMATDPQKHPRARQNVILELGLFIGALRRHRVCALCKGDLELPSDFLGVAYVAMDNAGGWKMKLLQEIKHAGLAVERRLV